MGYNRIIGMGNLGGDAELKQIGEMPLVEFSVACTEKFLKDGEKQERTEWLRCKAWGKRFSNLAQYLTKGKSVLVEGKLRTDKVEKDGETKFYTSIIVDNLEFAGGPKKSEATEDQGTSDDEPAF